MSSQDLHASVPKPWLWWALLAGAAYAIVGIVFGALADPSVSQRTVVAWRLAAWLVSAVLFAAHLAYEHFRLSSPPRSAAVHAAVGAAIGAFGLALGAVVHSWSANLGNMRLLRLALVVWPILTAVPAFLVALVASAVLARLSRRV